jgi:hypothetical protein
MRSENDPRLALRLKLARCAPGGARWCGRLGANASRHLRSGRLDFDHGGRGCRDRRQRVKAPPNGPSASRQREETKTNVFEADQSGYEMISSNNNLMETAQQRADLCIIDRRAPADDALQKGSSPCEPHSQPSFCRSASPRQVLPPLSPNWG